MTLFVIFIIIVKVILVLIGIRISLFLLFSIPDWLRMWKN